MKNGNKRLKLNFMGLKTAYSGDDDHHDDHDECFAVPFFYNLICFAVPDIW